jgi:hypothetical protein
MFQLQTSALHFLRMHTRATTQLAPRSPAACGAGAPATQTRAAGCSRAFFARTLLLLECALRRGGWGRICGRTVMELLSGSSGMSSSKGSGEAFKDGE